METTTLTTIAAMSEEDRTAWAREYAGAGTTTVDDVSAILEAVRSGDPAPDPKALLALVLDDHQEDELRERALLALYHHIEVVRADDDVESVPAVERMIERLARAPKEEQNEKLRARKSWIKLRHLIDNEAPLEVIVDTVQHLCRDESSALPPLLAETEQRCLPCFPQTAPGVHRKPMAGTDWNVSRSNRPARRERYLGRSADAYRRYSPPPPAETMIFTDTWRPWTQRNADTLLPPTSWLRF